jgi:hypothetical protein
MMQNKMLKDNKTGKENIKKNNDLGMVNRLIIISKPQCKPIYVCNQTSGVLIRMMQKKLIIDNKMRKKNIKNNDLGMINCLIMI